MKISIILPTFNRSKLLTQTIKNIQNQTFEDYELIIVNDASNDETINIIKQFKAIDGRIKLIDNNKNVGCAKSREFGLKQSLGELIVFIDDDDQWDNNKLMEQYNAIMHTNSDMAISDYYIFKNKNKIHKKMNLFAQKFKKQILKRPGPFFQSIMIKKELIKKIKNPFDSESIPSEDWNFFIELSKLNPTISYIDKPLFTWNIHDENQSLNLTKEAIALDYIINKHYDYIKAEHGLKVIASHYRRIARIYEKKIDIINIKKFYTKAFQTYPVSIKNISYYIAIIIGYKHSKGIINFIRTLRRTPNA